MPSLETAGLQSTVSDSATGLTSTFTQSATGTGLQTATSTGYVYSYATSKIVRTAVAAGVIVLAITAIVLFFKVSSWIRLRQRLRRQRLLALSIQSERQANAYEVAAWSDEPGVLPVSTRGPGFDQSRERKSRKERKNEMKAWKRGGANAYALHEWEGVAS